MKKCNVLKLSPAIAKSFFSIIFSSFYRSFIQCPKNFYAGIRVFERNQPIWVTWEICTAISWWKSERFWHLNVNLFRHDLAAESYLWISLNLSKLNWNLWKGILSQFCFLCNEIIFHRATIVNKMTWIMFYVESFRFLFKNTQIKYNHVLWKSEQKIFIHKNLFEHPVGELSGNG